MSRLCLGFSLDLFPYRFFKKIYEFLISSGQHGLGTHPHFLCMGAGVFS